MMARSIALIDTGFALIPSTHAASQGAGQIRPVNSGKLLVACSARTASRQRSRYTRSFQSGITLFSGQPVWQNGTPQSMQRAACVADLCRGEVVINLEPVVDALRHGAPPRRLAPIFQKPGYFTHARHFSLALPFDPEHPLVLLRKNLDESRCSGSPNSPESSSPADSRSPRHAARSSSAASSMSSWSQLVQIHARPIAARRTELARLVQHVSDPAGHARREILARLAQHDHQTLGHVLAAVIAHAFDHRRRARIAHRESLARASVEKRFARRRAVQSNISDQNVFFRQETSTRAADTRSACRPRAPCRRNRSRRLPAPASRRAPGTLRSSALPIR